MKKETRIAIVMAGGSGERFWPLSRKNKPKQLLRLTKGSQTLLEQTIGNILPVFGNSSIILATGKHLLEPISELGTGIPAHNIIAEPHKKNTAGCLAYIASVLISRDMPDSTLAVLPADHLYGDPGMFREILADALETAETARALVTLGVKPSRPETGYGYIEADDDIASMQNTSHGFVSRNVREFHEKPDSSVAEKYLGSGKHFWNSGIFFWKLEVFMAEMKKANPEIYTAILSMAEKMKDGDNEAVDAIFRDLPDISIDYALMERTRNVVMIETDFGWDDIGSWDALDRTFPRDEKGNVAVGDPVVIDATDCIVYNEPGKESMAVSVVGVEGLAVIVSKDGVLVIPKDRAQDVRKAVAELKKRDATQT